MTVVDGEISQYDHLTGNKWQLQLTILIKKIIEFIKKKAYSSNMDKIDQSLVAALRRDARASVSDLALELGVSRATVRSRMDKMIKNGDILGFTVVLKEDATEAPVRGITLIEIEGKGNQRVISQLQGFPEIQAIHSTNGRWDLIVEFGTNSLSDLDKALQRLRVIDGIQSSETSLFLGTHRSNRAKPAAF